MPVLFWTAAEAANGLLPLFTLFSSSRTEELLAEVLSRAKPKEAVGFRPVLVNGTATEARALVRYNFRWTATPSRASLQVNSSTMKRRQLGEPALLHSSEQEVQR